MPISAESIQEQIPYYLTKQQKEGLIKALNDFPHTTQYYSNLYPCDLLQGDGWSQFEVIRFEDGVRDKIKGIVLSNSCDVSSENKRDLPPKLTFAPIIKLANYAQLLQRNGLTQEQIESRFQAIREQRVTSMFYLPKSSTLDGEYVALP